MAIHPNAKKRLNLVIPYTLYHDLNGYAVLNHVSMTQVIRQAIMFWLLIAQGEDIKIEIDGTDYKLII
jgi:hypothetical protein